MDVHRFEPRRLVQDVPLQRMSAYHDHSEAMNKSKTLEILWTVTWFAMDACWMNGFLGAAHVLAAIGVLLSSRIWINGDDDPAVEAAHLATSCWFIMNSCWMMSESTPAWKEAANLFMCGGAVFMVATAIIDRDALAYFRRLRKQ